MSTLINRRFWPRHQPNQLPNPHCQDTYPYWLSLPIYSCLDESSRDDDSGPFRDRKRIPFDPVSMPWYWVCVGVMSWSCIKSIYKLVSLLFVPYFEGRNISLELIGAQFFCWIEPSLSRSHASLLSLCCLFTWRKAILLPRPFGIQTFYLWNTKQATAFACRRMLRSNGLKFMTTGAW